MDAWILSALTGGAGGVALSAALAFLLRSWILERLKAAVSFEYQGKLEELKLEHNRLLERFREERSEREALRSLALSSLTNMQTGLLQRRLQALEEFWRCVRELREAIPSYIFVVDMFGYQEATFGRNLVNFLRNARPETMLEAALPVMNKASDLRPLVGEVVYALFLGLQASYGRAATATVISYQSGELRKWYEDADIREVLRKILTESEIQQFLEFRFGNLDWLRRTIEERIIQEIVLVLSGRDTASENVNFARELIAAASMAASPSARPTS